MNKKVALVTGSTSGIGKATVLELLSAGCHVYVSSEKQGKDADLSVYEGRDYEYLQLDISDKSSVEKAAKAMSNLDYLVNNAGIMPIPCGIDDITDENIDKTISTNFKGTFYCLKYFGKVIQNTSKHGAIVNVSSVDGVIGEPYGVMYSATKAAIISLTKSFARYYKSPLVRVNAIAPGLIDTPLTASTGEDPSWTTDVSIINRMGKSQEIAKTISFLLSPSSSFTTGQTITVDGGFMLK